MATFSASLKEFSVPELLRLWSQYRVQSMKALFKTLAIDIKNYKEYLGKYDLTLDENMEASISSNDIDLDYGTYYLKETKTGTGYLPNDKVYEINFTGDNPTIDLTIENKVIEKEVTIKKLYGDGKLMQTEPNITFEIYDKDNNLVKNITTDQNGIAKIILPYGHYKIVQVNTTEGYTKIEPFEIFINDINKEYTYTINDYKKKEKNAPSSGITKRRFPFRMAPSSSLCLFFFSADDLIREHRRANQIRRIDIQRVRNVEKYLQRKTVGDPRRFD